MYICNETKNKYLAEFICGAEDSASFFGIYCKNKLEKLNINIQYAINIKGIKTNKSNYYATLKTWTISDVNKRNEAKRNGLNYLEIYPKFDINDVLKFIEKYYPVGTTNKQIIVGAVNNNTKLDNL